MENLKTIGSLGIFVILLAILGLGIYRVGFLTFVDNYEFAYYFDARTGDITPIINQDGTYKHGYVKTIPFIKMAHTIDLRPIQICLGANNQNTVNSANTRVLNCKLVQFNPEGYELFISWHGRATYDHNSLNRLLTNYAYDESQKNYTFLTITKELRNENYNNVSEPDSVVGK
jgi:hypothetical protein